MELIRAIENILFASPNPCTVQQLGTLSGTSIEEVSDALIHLTQEFSVERGGLTILEHEGRYTLASNPDAAALLLALRKEEGNDELSRPALETLAVIAYQGPVTKPEIEQIRGVNCSVSLRNLLIAGLIEENETTPGERSYTVSVDFLRHLGVTSLPQLPDYEHLNTLLRNGGAQTTSAQPEEPLNI